MICWLFYAGFSGKELLVCECLWLACVVEKIFYLDSFRTEWWWWGGGELRNPKVLKV